MATRQPLPEALSSIDRRRFLQLTAGVAAMLGLSQLPAGIARAARPSAAYPFTLGVASGDPSPDGFALWTRLAPDPHDFDGGMGASRGPVEVDWQVAADEAMSTIVASGTAVAVSATT